MFPRYDDYETFICTDVSVTSIIKIYLPFKTRSSSGMFLKILWNFSLTLFPFGLGVDDGTFLDTGALGTEPFA